MTQTQNGHVNGHSNGVNGSNPSNGALGFDSIEDTVEAFCMSLCTSKLAGFFLLTST